MARLVQLVASQLGQADCLRLIALRIAGDLPAIIADKLCSATELICKQVAVRDERLAFVTGCTLQSRRRGLTFSWTLIHEVVDRVGGELLA